jgi:ferritin
MMQAIFYISFLVLLVSIVRSTEMPLNSGVGECLSELATQELSGSYNYLQLSSKFGSANAYPGFSSLFIKLSDDDSSKSHDLMKFLALRQYKTSRLISISGIKIRNEITKVIHIYHGLTEARNQNEEAWKIVARCHQMAADMKDANVQDYLESHVLNHHIKVDKLLSDFQNRLNANIISDKKLLAFMLDEELLNTYGDRRSDIFS